MDWVKILDTLLQYGALGIIAYFYIKNNERQNEKQMKIYEKQAEQQSKMFDKLVNNVLESNSENIKVTGALTTKFDALIQKMNDVIGHIGAVGDGLVLTVAEMGKGLEKTINEEKKFDFDSFEAIAKSIMLNSLYQIKNDMEIRLERNHLVEQHTILCGVRNDRCDGEIHNTVKHEFSKARDKINKFKFSERLRTKLTRLSEDILHRVVDDLCRIFTVLDENYDKEYISRQIHSITSKYVNEIDDIFKILRGDDEL